MAKFGPSTACHMTILLSINVQIFMGLNLFLFFRNLETEDQTVQICKEKFQLSSLSKDRSVSPLQMSDCCERLSKEDNPDLNNSTLIVSKYYHVNEDGHISIPWNWK